MVITPCCVWLGGSRPNYVFTVKHQNLEKKAYHPLCRWFQRSYCTEILCGWSIVDSHPYPDFLWWNFVWPWGFTCYPPAYPCVEIMNDACVDHFISEMCSFSSNIHSYWLYLLWEWRMCIHDLATVSIHVSSKWYAFFSRFCILGTT